LQPRRSGQRPHPGSPQCPGHHQPAAKVGYQAVVAQAHEPAAHRHPWRRPLHQPVAAAEAERLQAEMSSAWPSQAGGSAAEWLRSVAWVPAVRVERPSRSQPGRSSFQTPVERGATAWVVEVLADPRRVSRPRFPGALLARRDRPGYSQSWDATGLEWPRWPPDQPIWPPVAGGLAVLVDSVLVDSAAAD